MSTNRKKPPLKTARKRETPKQREERIYRDFAWAFQPPVAFTRPLAAAAPAAPAAPAGQPAEPRPA